GRDDHVDADHRSRAERRDHDLPAGCRFADDQRGSARVPVLHRDRGCGPGAGPDRFRHLEVPRDLGLIAVMTVSAESGRPRASIRVRAALAGGLVFGIATSLTVASWTD